MSLARKLLMAAGIAKTLAVVAGGVLQSAVAGATHTFAAAPIGTPGNARSIHVLVRAANATVRTISSLTVDGVALAASIEDTDASNFHRLSIWSGYVNTANATGSIVVNFSGSLSTCEIIIIEGHNLSSMTPTATDVEETDATAMTAAVTQGGFALGAAATSGAGVTYTWTGDGAEIGDANSLSGAIAGPYPSSTTATMTSDASGGTQNNSVMATFL